MDMIWQPKHNLGHRKTPTHAPSSFLRSSSTLFYGAGGALYILVVTKGQIAHLKAIHCVRKYARPSLVSTAVRGVVQCLIHLDKQFSQVECQFCHNLLVLGGFPERFPESRPVRTPAEFPWCAPGRGWLVQPGPRIHT